MSVNIQSPDSKPEKANSMSSRAHKSWADEVTYSETKSQNTSRDESASPEGNTSANNISNSSNQSDRQISVEFIDDVNEEKYKRLVLEEKIKTPFKRRHENDSRSNSPNTSNSDGSSECTEYKEKKRYRHNSQTSSTSYYFEKDPAVLARRQKQIDYGKNTVAYERFIEAVPRSKRTKDHPNTPNKHGKYSRRAFDGLVKIWRKQLHHYDPPEENKQSNANDSSSEESE